VRVQREVLEDHGDAAVPRGEVVGELPVEHDGARTRVLQPGDHPQNRRLAASGRAEEHHELTVADVEVDVVDGDRAVRKHLRHVFECDGRHPVTSQALENGGPAATPEFCTVTKRARVAHRVNVPS
jgi:hypothetical protein